MTIGIVILNFNGWNDTVECLSSLLSIDLSPGMSLEIVVVDNASKISIADQFLRWQNSMRKNRSGHTFTLIENKKNRGFAGGNNDGMRYLMNTEASFILLLNNDTIVDKRFLINLVKGSTRYGNGITGPKIYFAPGYEFHKKYRNEELGKVIWYAGGLIDWNNMYCFHRGVDQIDHGQYDVFEETDFVTGCCMLLARSVIDKIGYLNEEYFAYLEDVEYCMRAKLAGFSPRYDPSSYIWHKNAQSSGSSGSDIHVYYQTRNRMMIGMTYASYRTKFALLRESIVLMSHGGIKRKAIVDFYLHHYGQKK